MKIRWRTETIRETHEINTVRIRNLDGFGYCRRCGEPATSPEPEQLAEMLGSGEPDTGGRIDAMEIPHANNAGDISLNRGMSPEDK